MRSRGCCGSELPWADGAFRGIFCSTCPRNQHDCVSSPHALTFIGGHLPWTAQSSHLAHLTLNATVLQHSVQKFSSRTRICEGCHLHPLPSVIFTEDADYSAVAFDTSWVSADGQETPLLQDICSTPGAVTRCTGPSPAPCRSWLLVTTAYTCYHVVWMRDIDLLWKMLDQVCKL